MRSRGSLLRGRTAFSIYRFDNRDRAFVIALFTCITLTAMGVILGASNVVQSQDYLAASERDWCCDSYWVLDALPDAAWVGTVDGVSVQ